MSNQELNIQVSGYPVEMGGGCHVVYRNDDVALIYVDLATKRTVLFSSPHGRDNEAPCVVLDVDKGSLHVKTQHTEPLTEIKFLDFPGWQVFAADGQHRYTLAVVLHKEATNG